MEKLQFTTEIDAPKETVWKALWEEENYNEWTSAFAAGSTAESDWKEGSKILFLDGKGEGMVSIIDANRPFDFMSFRHIGQLKNNVEDTSSPEVMKWKDSTENYSLTYQHGKTTVTVDLDADGDFAGYLEKAFPKALEKLKALAERL